MLMKLRKLLKAAIEDLKNMDAGGDVCYGCKRDDWNCPYQFECIRQKGHDADYWEWRGIEK